MSSSLGRIGELPGQDGASQPVRLTKYGSQSVGDAHARYTEATYRNHRYISCTTAAVALSLTGTTTYTGLLLNNPANSGVIVVVDNVSWAVTSTITASGGIALAYNTANPSALGTVLASSPARLSTSGTSGARAVTYSGGTNTLAANPTVIRPIATAQFGTSVGVIVQMSRDEIAGSIQLNPGTDLIFTALTTAVTGFWAIEWEELPITIWTV
jgi:hypothetical protein